MPKIKAATGLEHGPWERALKQIDILQEGGRKASPGKLAHNDLLVP